MIMLNLKVAPQRVISQYAGEHPEMVEKLENDYYGLFDLALQKAGSDFSFRFFNMESNFLEFYKSNLYNCCELCKAPEATVACLLCGVKLCLRFCGKRDHASQESSPTLISGKLCEARLPVPRRLFRLRQHH